MHGRCIIVFLFLSLAATAAAQSNNYGDPETKLALNGYDTVAYFREGKAKLGKAKYAAEWNGVTWRFSSEANRKRFEADPEKYQPEFGGLCSWSMSEGRLEVANPECFTIEMGRLYLHFNRRVQKQFEEELKKRVNVAHTNWEILDPDVESIHNRMRNRMEAQAETAGDR